jgi:NADPH2 dehydrogenase
LEVAKACVAAVGAERVGIRLSPYSEYQAMRMADPEPTFTYLISELRKLDLAYLHLTTPRVQGATDVKNPKENMDWAVKTWGPDKPIFLAGAFRPDTAKVEVEKWKGYQMCIAFGRYFISTPDLVFRIKRGLPVNRYDRNTFYAAGSDKGYIDYPFSKEWVEEQKGEQVLAVDNHNEEAKEEARL